MKIKNINEVLLTTSWLKTPLGAMLAIADEKTLYLLEFADQRGIEHQIEKLRVNIKCQIVSGKTHPIQQIESELQAYFDGSLKKFNTPLHLVGTPFQQLVWSELKRISYGKTKSYAEQAMAIGKQTAYRAVANANAANPIAIVIPCHR